MEDAFIFSLILLPVAVIYSSVGHGGASGYLAIMALSGFTPELMKPTALTLNIIVSGICTYRYISVGYFSWRIFLPFALVSAPFAFVGGGFNLPDIYYKPLVGLIMWYAAWHIFIMSQAPEQYSSMIKIPDRISVIGGGMSIGFLSGLTGVGGDVQEVLYSGFTGRLYGCSRSITSGTSNLAKNRLCQTRKITTEGRDEYIYHFVC